jgi:hypothetical protein
MTLWVSDDIIHGIVKRDILTSERGSIATLNDMPAWMVEETRAIARESVVGAVRYVRFYVATQRGSSAEDFIEDVVLKGQDAATWMIRDCVCFAVERTYTTALEMHYLQALSGVDGERWFRIKRAPPDHHSDSLSGAVGVLKRQVRYWHTAPDGLDLYSARPEDIERVEPGRVESSVRRWIAHRIAWWTREYLAQRRGGVTGDTILAAVPEVDRSKVTADARIATEALAREAAAYGGSPEFPAQAGFLGPEDWYQASP